MRWLTHQASIFVNVLKSKFRIKLNLISVFCHHFFGTIQDFDLFRCKFTVYGIIHRSPSILFPNLCRSVKALPVFKFYDKKWNVMTNKSGAVGQAAADFVSK